METKDARALLESRGIRAKNIKKTVGSFGKELFLVDGSYILRTSSSPMDAEISKFERVRELPSVPRVLDSGSWESDLPGRVNWILADLIPGEELYGRLGSLDGGVREGIALSLSAFLDSLHRIEGEAYDIGHYIPTVPGFAGSWREGHRIYWDGLVARLSGMKTYAVASSGLKAVLDRCDEWYAAHESCLDYQGGPCLLHNDFHPKNVIVNGNRFSGVIDWECSQWGEADFDLIHFAHWTLTPFSPGPPLDDLAASLLAAQNRSLAVPRLRERIILYMIEHEAFQMVLRGGEGSEIFVPRLEFWLAGETEGRLGELGL